MSLSIKFNSILPITLGISLLFFQQACKGPGTTQNTKKVAQSSNTDKITAAFIQAATKQAQNYPDDALKGYQIVLQLAPQHAAANFNVSKILFEKLQYEQALPYAEKALKADANNVWYFVQAATVYDKLNRTPDAAKSLEIAVKKYPKDVDLKIQLSDYYLKLQRYTDAIALYDSIEARTGMIETMARQKKEVYMYLNKPEKAIAEIRRLVDLFPEKAEYYYDLFNLYVTLKRNEDALRLLQELIQKHPDDSFALFRLVDYYISNNEQKKADELLERAFSNPNIAAEAKIQFLTRRLAFDTSAPKNPDIRRMVEKLYQQNPTLGSVLVLKAQLSLSANQPDSARFYIKNALKYEDTAQRLWEQLLTIDLQFSNADTLLADTQEALEVYPNILYFNYMHGLAHYQKKNYTQATRIFEKCALMQTDNRGLMSDVYMLLGDCYHYQNDNVRSDKNFNKAINQNPDNYTALNNYAYFLSLRGEKLDSAQIYIEKVIKVMPDNASYQDTYGWVLYKRGKYKDALIWIEKAYKQGASADVADHLGDVYYQLGETEKALNYWKEARTKGLNNEIINRKINTGKL